MKLTAITDDQSVQRKDRRTKQSLRVALRSNGTCEVLQKNAQKNFI